MLFSLGALSACTATLEQPQSDTSFRDNIADTAAGSGQADNTGQSQGSQNAEAGEAQTDSSALETAEISTASDSVEALLAPYGQSVAVVVVPLGLGSASGDSSASLATSSSELSINGDVSFASASMIKLLILATYMSEVDTGLIDPSEGYFLTEEDIVGGTGILQNSTVGTGYTYEDLAHYMIAYSDNTAANVLIDKLGMSTINAKASELGLSNTVLQRKMMDTTSGLENYMSANDAAVLLEGIASRTLASASLCQQAESSLLEQSDSEGILQGLSADVSFAHKTGSLDTVRHDGGIVRANGAGSSYVIVVFTSLGGVVSSASQANALMAEVAQAVNTALNGN